MSRVLLLCDVGADSLVLIFKNCDAGDLSYEKGLSSVYKSFSFDLE